MARISIDLEAAENCMGYMSHNNLVWLAEQAHNYERIVEIGTYLGRSTRALGDNTPGVVYTIDNFQGPKDINIPEPIRKNTFELFLWSCRDLLERGKVQVIIADHAVAEVPVSPDMVFLDGSHTYLDLRRDILKWSPQITGGGLICGDDYTNMFTVRQAVNEIFGKNAKVAKGTSIWYVRG